MNKIEMLKEDLSELQRRVNSAEKAMISKKFFLAIISIFATILMTSLGVMHTSFLRFEDRQYSINKEVQECLQDLKTLITEAQTKAAKTPMMVAFPTMDHNGRKRREDIN